MGLGSLCISAYQTARSRRLLVGLSGVALVAAIGIITAQATGSSVPTKPVPNATVYISAPIPLGGPKFAVSLCTDLAGNLWVGSEDEGVWRLSAEALATANSNPTKANDATIGMPSEVVTKAWSKYTTKDGLGDNYTYGLTCDKLGRIWVGHLNHGVSVFNGKDWQNYNVLPGLPREGVSKDSKPARAGPLGERVFALATCPTDGDVWMATNVGLSRYLVKSDTWDNYTRVEGLPSDQITTLAFQSNGDIVVGTACDGLVLANAANNYTKWRNVRCPKEFENSVPLAPSGVGLATNLINHVLVAKDGTVNVATPSGLCVSKDRGQTFSYLRGANWADKVKGLYGDPPPGWKETKAATLTEDYITQLAVDTDGALWVGHWRTGYETIIPTAFPQSQCRSRTSEYVSSLLVTGHITIAGFYGSCVASVRGAGATRRDGLARTVVPSTDQKSPPAFPAGAAAPDLVELKAQYAILKPAKTPTPSNTSGIVSVLPDDWRTRGEWLGRYGRYWASLSAMDSPKSYYWGAGAEPVRSIEYIGGNSTRLDAIRYWVDKLHTDDLRALEMPPTYLDSCIQRGFTRPGVERRQAEIDDHGEAYPMHNAGPNLYVNVAVPNGMYILSAYFVNKDGHGGPNRYRDYTLSLRATDRIEKTDVRDFASRPELAHARVRDFWGGVYKRFLVRGPAKLTLEINRNYSFNTICSSVMLDELGEYSEPYFPPVNQTVAERYSALNKPDISGATESLPETADALFKAYQAALADEHGAKVVNNVQIPILLARYYTTLGSTATSSEFLPALGTCYYRIGLFHLWEETLRQRGLIAHRTIEKAIKWDGVSGCSGKGREFVLKQVQRTTTLPNTESLFRTNDKE